MSRFNAFYDTRRLFLTALEYARPLTFEEWKAKPNDLKAAYLYVQYYSEITLAWDKADSLDWGDDQEGVSTILQYLRKNVSTIQYFQKADPSKKANSEFRAANPDGYVKVERRIIEEDPSKFSPGYIYRVAYNCLYCICGHDRQCDKDRMNYETSAITTTSEGEELSVFDSYVDKNLCIESTLNRKDLEFEFWSMIEEAGAPAEKVMRYLLSQDPASLKALNSRNRRYKLDPLRDVEVSLEAVDDILQDLRERFLSMPSNSACGQYISTFLNSFA